MEKLNMDGVKINNKRSRSIVNPFKYIYRKVCAPGSCRRVGRSIGVIFVVISIFYGLIWVPSQQLKINQQNYLINVDMTRLGLTKIQNACQVIARNSLAAYEEQSEVVLTDEQKQQLADQFFGNCLFLEGLQAQNQN